MTVSRPPLHPACAAYPPLPDDAFKELVADLKANGQRDSIVMLHGEILDGRLRWDGCLEAQLEPRYREFGSDPTDGDDPVRFVLSKNQHRRHMTYAERCFTADAMAGLLHGSNQYQRKVEASNEASSTLRTTITEAAAALNVSRAGAQDARAVRTYMPELEEAIKKGEMSIRSAAEQARKASPRAGNSYGPKKAAKGKKERLPRIDPPMLYLEVATAAETGRPPDDAPLAEHLAWRERIGAKVPLWSVTGKQLLEDRSVVQDCAMLILRIANFPHPSEDVFERLDRMLAHVPKRDSKSGDQFDFAGAARDTLRTLKRDLDNAIDKLTSYREALTDRAR
jgi:hypothetical protein